MINAHLKFYLNTEMLCKKGQQPSCLRKRGKFQADKTLLTLLYSAFIESVISFPVTYWFGSLDNREENGLQKY